VRRVWEAAYIMKANLTLGLALVAPCLIGGCAASGDGPSFGNVGRNFADDWTGARGYDRAALALDRGDLPRVREVGRALNARIEGGSRGAFSVASAWMNARAAEAGALETEASDTGDAFDRIQTRRDANRLYRGALAFLPSNRRTLRQLDPQTLNSLGYFLAQRGGGPKDFRRAADLTHLALELSPATNSVERFVRASGPQDSYAWALFKQGQTAKALATQIEVLSTLSDKSYKNFPINAEVVYHMGAILRVAGHEEQARAAFRAALGLKPSVELEEILNSTVEGRVT